MIALAPEYLTDLRRWLISAAVVLSAHGGLAAAMVTWKDPVDLASPAAAIVIEFAPVPVGPAKLETEIPPGPEQVMSDAAPDRPTPTSEQKIEEKIEHKVEAKVEQKVEEKVEPKPVEEPPPEVKPAPNPEVAVVPPAPPEVKQETPQRQEPRPPAPTTSAPQAVPVETAAIPAAPEQGKPNPVRPKPKQTWEGQMSALIERNKRYPAKAQSRGAQGVAQVSFSLDRQGRLIESRIVRSSGVAVLDEESLALLRRAQPFPPPPPDRPGERVDVNVQIRFNLK